MKKYLAIFVVVGLCASLSAIADTQEYKACMKRCMSKVDDKEKCEYVCEEYK